METNQPVNAAEKRKLAGKIIDVLIRKGHRAFLAGGCVRDLVMKRIPQDFDIATNASPDEIEALFKKTVAVGKQFGVIIVVIEDLSFEVTTFRKEGKYTDGRHPSHVEFTDAETDAKRRDFTVNGLFYDFKENRIIDYVDGQTDIAKKIIRTIGKPEERFDEDKLRLLRAVRFAANLNFALDPLTLSSIKRMADQIHCVSPERIRDELIKLFTRGGAGKGMELLSETGLLKQILPEIEVMKGVRQPPEFHPEGDVYVHTKMLMDRLENASTTLAFGALLHDVGKPATFSDENGVIHFFNHSKIGSQIAEKLLRRLRFPNKQIDEIISCVNNHMKFADVRVMRMGKLKQFVSRSTFTDELELHRIDCKSSHGMLDNYVFLKDKLVEYETENLKPKPLINGHDVMACGIKPGPRIKEILEKAYELQLEGKMPDRSAAIAWVREHYLRNDTRHGS